MNRYPDIVGGLIAAAILMAAGYLMTGCCALSKRSCFPACPPPKVATVEKPCELPPLKLPAANETSEGCPADHICYDKSNGANLAVRLAKMRNWISGARERCGEVAPASRPSER